MLSFEYHIPQNVTFKAKGTYAAAAILDIAHRTCRNKRVTTIQKWVRMHLQRARYRRDTDAGRRTAERAAVEAQQLAAATVIQREARRWAAGRKVLG